MSLEDIDPTGRNYCYSLDDFDSSDVNDGTIASAKLLQEKEVLW